MEKRKNRKGDNSFRIVVCRILSKYKKTLLNPMTKCGLLVNLVCKWSNDCIQVFIFLTKTRETVNDSIWIKSKTCGEIFF